MNGVELKMLENLADDGRLKKASVNNLAYAFQNLHNARRLESGQSTANVGINIESRLSKAIQDAADKRKEQGDN